MVANYTYGVLSGRSSALQVGKALGLLRHGNQSSMTRGWAGGGASWGDGVEMTGPKLSEKWGRGGKLKRVMMISARPTSLAETHPSSGGHNLAPQRYGAAMVQAGLHAGKSFRSLRLMSRVLLVPN